MFHNCYQYIQKNKSMCLVLFKKKVYKILEKEKEKEKEKDLPEQTPWPLQPETCEQLF